MSGREFANPEKELPGNFKYLAGRGQANLPRRKISAIKGIVTSGRYAMYPECAFTLSK
jgi:hypothetical protein